MVMQQPNGPVLTAAWNDGGGGCWGTPFRRLRPAWAHSRWCFAVFG